ncbi:MAG TPA: response regulator transcription factor [Acidobacteriaceae bacterium]|jgi:DNA-binding NarL/FixJ family response regulator|nr:response regulator transcription factor [Acidobacteriaceae bacterium]
MLTVPARVVVYDSSVLQCELLTAGLESLRLGFEIRSVNDLESLIELLTPDPDWVVIISDSSMSGNAISVAKRLRARFSGLPFVFLSKEGRSDRVIEAFRTGARGIVYGDETLSQLAKCISRVRQGEVWLRGGDLGIILEGLVKPSLRVTDVTGRTLLSPREEEISRLVALGMSNREVSHVLKISESTVKNSLFHVFEKLGISNRVELARYVNGTSEGEGPAIQ